MCRVLSVKSNGFYDWCNCKPSLQTQHHDIILKEVKKSHEESNEIYGYRKVYEDLIGINLQCCSESIRRAMKALGLRSCIKRKHVVTTDSNHNDPVAPNILARDFTTTAPNQKWVTDITYIETQESWLYLAAVMDLFTRKIVGWAMSEHIDSALVIAALDMALFIQQPTRKIIIHSDRGSQYTSNEYQKKLSPSIMNCSMSRKGNCWDNAPMESFFGSLKSEWVYQKKIYKTRDIAKNDVFNYIEIFYNRKRRHASLGYVSPNTFEQMNEVNTNRAA